MDPKCSIYERISDVSSSSLSGTSPKKPNLEFTLGRPHWWVNQPTVYYHFEIIISLMGTGEENQVPSWENLRIKEKEKKKREKEKKRKRELKKDMETR